MNLNKKQLFAAHPLPWKVFAGTIVRDVHGKTVFSAHEESERCGGSFLGIRAALKQSVKAVNSHAELVRVLKEALTRNGVEHDTTLKEMIVSALKTAGEEV